MVESDSGHSPLRSGRGDWVPIPDPTHLTTEALHREISALRQAFQTEHGWMRDILETRYRGFQKEYEAARALLASRIDALAQLTEEKFSGVAQQFELVAEQRREQKGDTKMAVDAALTAQEKAVREQTIASERAIDRSQAATEERIKQLEVTLSTALEGLRRADDDQSRRIGKIEGLRLGSREQAGDRRGSDTILLTIGGLILTFVIIAVSLYLGMR